MPQYTKGFRQLIAWQKAHALTLDIYRITSTFPRDERYGITDQLRRAVSSTSAQLVEGSRMPTAPHRKLYFDRAYASLAEVDYFLELSYDLGYLSKEQYSILTSSLNRTSFFIKRLIHPLKEPAPNTLQTPRT